MISLNCTNCDWFISEADNLCFYEKGFKNIFLIVKFEKIDAIRDNLTLVEEENKTKQQYVRNIILCKSCECKIGSESYNGPNGENVFHFKPKTICINGQRFSKTQKWSDMENKFSFIEKRNDESFYGSNLNNMTRLETILPNLKDASQFNIGSCLLDLPKNYQLELYLSALTSNTIICLPTGSGKTLIATMVSIYMNKLNPSKKIFYVCDTKELVKQTSIYLKLQTELSIGELYDFKLAMEEIQLKYDILVLTVDFFIHVINNNIFSLINCSLVIFDEIINYLKNDDKFTNMLETSYFGTESIFRPRLVCLTSFPEKTDNEFEMENEITCLCRKLSAKICIPIEYSHELEKQKISTRFKLLDCENDQKLHGFINCIYEFIQEHSLMQLKLKNHKITQVLIDKISIDSTQDTDHKKYIIKSFLQKMLNSIEIAKVLGITYAIEFINQCIIKEQENNIKSNTWSEFEIENMIKFLFSIEKMISQSPKIDLFIQFLKTNANNKSRTLIIVRTHITARCILNYLNKDIDIKNNWKPTLFLGKTNQKSINVMDLFEEQELAQDFKIYEDSRLLVATITSQETKKIPECDHVILFDLSWLFNSSLSQALSKNAQINAILSLDEKKLFDQFNRSELLLKKMINKLNNHNLIYEASYLLKQIELNQKIYKINQPIKKEFFSNKNYSSKFFLQIYTEDNTKHVGKLLFMLKKCKGFLSSNTHKKICSNLEIFQRTKAIVCSFEFRQRGKYSENDEENFILETVRFLFENNDFYLLINHFKPKEKLTANNTSYQIMSQELRFGNLATAFDFYSSKTNLNQKSISGTKFIIKYDSRFIIIICFINDILHKFEIAFNSIDQFIILHDEIEFINVYIPTKRHPLVYRLVPDILTNVFGYFKSENLATLDDENLSWERVCFLDIESSLHLKFGIKEKFDVIKGLKSLRGLKILFGTVERHYSNYQLNDIRKDFNSTDFSLCYYLECFLSQCGYFLNGKISKEFTKKINDFDIKKCKCILEKLTFCLPNYRYLNILSILESKIMETFSSDFKYFLEDPKIILIRRCTVTPSRVIFHFEEPNFSNRLTRRFGSERFLRVRFRDEDFKKLNMAHTFSSMKQLYSRIYEFLINEFLLCKVKYEFLAMSSSQLREHACWLFSSNNDYDAQKVRNWMGDFSGIKCVGKYAARLGQSLSCSVETFKTNEFSIIPDIKVKNEITQIEYCFSDGIGKISEKKANDICKDFYQIPYASAFQIRFAGFKGVVAVDPNLKGDQLQFRESMKKFESGHNRLDVLNVAGYIPCYLNRQIIIILSSLGIKDEAFSQLLEKSLKQSSNMLINRHVAFSQIMRYYNSVFAEKSQESRLNYIYEPFFRSLLNKIHKKLLQDLVTKSKIFVQKGRILMGTIDETGVLKENQVFIRCKIGLFDSNIPYEGICQNDDVFIVNSKVAIAKNPCMHPGDIRVMNAIDHPLLHHMIDCIVFPSVGSRPITNMCSGSDLDGDLYFVTWDTTLIPQKVEEPAEYETVPPKNHDSQIEVKNIIKFFVDFIEMDQLGRIANAHVAISDFSGLGVKDPNCIELARIFNLAVDFPKTGYVAELPKNLKITEYPDFMERKGRSYESNKIIGIMYRKCKNISFNNYSEEILINPSFIIEGYKDYLEEAIDTYTKYRDEIERIMLYFECLDESELFVGFSLNPNKSKEQNSFFKYSSTIVKRLWSDMRDIFFQQLKSDENPRILEKASAWYYACYSSTQNKRLKILSFPWILKDVFNKFNIRNYDIFFRSIVENYCENRDDFQSMDRFKKKIELKNKISKFINTKLIICGSFGLFLFENNNEVQLFTIESKKSTEEIKSNLDYHFDRVSTGNGIVKCLHDDETEFTINESKNSILRFLYIRKMIFAQPILLAFLYTIVHFARLDGIFSFLNAKKIKLDHYLLFFIEFCIKENFLKDISILDIQKYYEECFLREEKLDEIDEWNAIQDNLDKFIENDENFFNKEIGKYILMFYKEQAYDSDEIIFSNKFDENVIILSKTENVIIKDHFSKRFNALVRTDNISNVWFDPDEVSPDNNTRNLLKNGRKNVIDCLYNEAFLFLISNYKNDLDYVEFEIYKGNRRSIHLNKECWIAKSQKNSTEFSSECQEKIILHSLKQFDKAKFSSMQNLLIGHKFKLQLKFGDIYFTDLPALFLEENSSILFCDLNLAFHNRQKSFSFKSLQSGKKMLVMEKSNNQLNILKHESKNKRIMENSAYSAFDSNVKTNEFWHSIFLENEFEVKSSENFVAYLELKERHKDKKLKNFRIKYNSNFQLVNIKPIPIKWINIDIKNETNIINNRDIRIDLTSTQLVSLEENIYELDTILSDLNVKINSCVFKKLGEDIIVEKEFRNAKIFLRHSKKVNYTGYTENWKPIFDFIKFKIPENFPFYVLRKIILTIADVNEYSDNDKLGQFTIVSKRKEIFFTLKININTTSKEEFKDIIYAIWLMGIAFAKIIT